MWFHDLNTNRWNFVGGSIRTNSVGNYSVTLWPGGRQNHSAVWQSSAQSIFVFGGYGISDNAANSGYLNDVWQWKLNSSSLVGGSWDLIYGGLSTSLFAVYTGAGVSPAARMGHQMLIEPVLPVFYIYGGFGYDNIGPRPAQYGWIVCKSIHEVVCMKYSYPT